MILDVFRSIFKSSSKSGQTEDPKDVVPGFVLHESLTEESTSNVDEDVIRDAFSRFEGGYIALTRCRPLVTGWGTCETIQYGYDGNRDEPLVYIFINTGTGLLRYRPYEPCGVDVANEIMCSFFTRSEIPDLDCWKGECLSHEPAMQPQLVLYIDKTSFRRFDYEDVMAALQKVERGDSDSLVLHTDEFLDGYMEVRFNAGEYQVRIAGLVAGNRMRGYRIATIYTGQVIRWLGDYYHHSSFPTVTSDWEDAEIADYSF